MKYIDKLDNKWLLFFLFSIIVNTGAAEVIGFDVGWKFYQGNVGEDALSPGYNDSGWRQLDLPHDWSIEGIYEQTANGTDWQSGYLPAGTGWYRKTFAYNPDWKDKKVRIQFDGIYLNSEVWINGHSLGKRPNGYVGFEYDLTPFLKEGDNCIAVKVDQSKPLTGRWYTGSGIYRHVRLNISSPVHIAYSGVCFKVDTFLTDKALCSVVVSIVNPGKEKVRVVSCLQDTEGRIIARTTGSESVSTEEKVAMSVTAPERWSPENPVVYTLVCRLEQGGNVLDEVQQFVGFRSLEFSPEFGFKLNGKVTKLKGVCDHHTAGAVGAAVPEDILHYRLRLLKEMGCNAIRTAHNPFSPEFYTMCDTMGLMVLNEGLDGWNTPKAADDYGHYFEEWWERDMTDFIKRDRNHPSVIMWSIGNEVNKASPEIQRNLVDLFHSLDSRPVTQGGADPTRGMSVDYKENFGRLDIVGFNGNGEEVGEFEKFRNDFPSVCAVATEVPHTYQTRGVYRTKTQWRRRDFPAPWEQGDPVKWDQFEKRVFPIPDLTEEEFFPEEAVNPYYQSSYDNASVRISIRKAWQRTCSFPWLMGEFRWGSFDYLGEAEWPQRCGNFGIIDVAAMPKDAYYLYQSLWSDKPMVHLLPHWTHTGKEGQIVPVVVYTNCESVELLLNDVSLGTQSYDGEQLVWKVPYKAGKIEARAKKGDKIVATDVQQTASSPYTVAFSANKLELKASSSDVARLELDVVDRNGVLCPYASDELVFELTGPVRLLGVDNGDPVDMFPYKQPRCHAFRGKCVLLLQATDTQGTAVVTVRSARLKEKKITLDIK
ncbi:sugar-binding domain-containing protein [uncultured Parabacteroides sp.]|jgi:beta-galactosidase|uniref:sugar-binding domain-containing protein n=1 Tax=uncultured Parabacteroides sp. TaxID=512312 RepID=UPI0025F61BCC|nr:sugar-binding domain-containing protein [uncultured Parabacteroides sp.]